MRMDARSAAPEGEPDIPRLWVERLTLTDFRNYANAVVTAAAAPVVLIGSNGAGKTNILEAVSLLGPGQGMRRAAYGDLTRSGAAAGWAVAGRVHTPSGAIDIGTGLPPGTSATGRSGRIVRIDGVSQSGTGILADYVELVWVTPAMDGLFTGPGGDRRRFLDRLILCFDPGYRTRAAQFERAMQQRNRLLADNVRDAALFAGLETIMAETGVAIAASRAEAVLGLKAMISARRQRDPDSPFPWAELAIEGRLEAELSGAPAVEVEDSYLRTLRDRRERDRAAGRTLEGPHRSDLVVGHGPKGMPARVSSTGEQKALLLGIVLAHAQMVRERRGGTAPLMLLDEVSAHLDQQRRAALFEEILRIGAQAWLTGTDLASFDSLAGRAQFRTVRDGNVSPCDPP